MSRNSETSSSIEVIAVGIQYLQTNVFEAAIQRINFVFDEFENVIVSMSGGKDSTVLYEMTKQVARERGRLPLRVFFLDQEAEWRGTRDYMHGVMHDPETLPFHFQIPFKFTNSLSLQENFLHVWDPAARDVWIHEQDPIAIKVNPTPYDRYHKLVHWLPNYCGTKEGEPIAVLVGMRSSESSRRRIAIEHQTSNSYKGVTWTRKPVGNARGFWGIYDFTDNDIWTAIAKHGWKYNHVYDEMYRYGVQKANMRISALIHETAWKNAQMLQEIEPRTYELYLRRIIGMNCFAHFQRDIMPKELPGVFASWQDYRDYLLIALVKPEYHKLFRNRWRKQIGDAWYKVHVQECMIQDIDGTLNANARDKIAGKTRQAEGGVQAMKKRARLNEAIREGAIIGGGLGV